MGDALAIDQDDIRHPRKLPDSSDDSRPFTESEVAGDVGKPKLLDIRGPFQAGKVRKGVQAGSGCDAVVRERRIHTGDKAWHSMVGGDSDLGPQAFLDFASLLYVSRPTQVVIPHTILAES
jgi:hypothetical protein